MRAKTCRLKTTGIGNANKAKKSSDSQPKCRGTKGCLKAGVSNSVSYAGHIEVLGGPDFAQACLCLVCLLS